MTIKRTFSTEGGYALRLTTFEPGKGGAEVLTGYFKKGERFPYRVTKEIK
jgi:hypothetical protein